MGLTIELPWPDKKLSSNARVHWAPKAKAVASYRNSCAWLARSQGVMPSDADAVQMVMTFHPPDKRRRDLDNLISATKALRDGIMDAIGIDDSRFVVTYRVGETRAGGMVQVEFADE
jgi:crossover junction endodeoxyribonuclease RusA